MTVEARIAELGITLPEPAKPVASYVSFVRSGNQITISGQLSNDANGGIKGTVGVDVTPEQAVVAARLCGINLIAQIKAAVDGDLERVVRIVKLGAFVQAGPEFEAIPAVINGCSDLMSRSLARPANTLVRPWGSISCRWASLSRSTRSWRSADLSNLGSRRDRRHRPRGLGRLRASDRRSFRVLRLPARLRGVRQRHAAPGLGPAASGSAR